MKEIEEAWQAKMDTLKEANKPMLALKCVATKEYEEKLNTPISKDPKDLQEYVYFDLLSMAWLMGGFLAAWNIFQEF